MKRHTLQLLLWTLSFYFIKGIFAFRILTKQTLYVTDIFCFVCFKLLNFLKTTLYKLLTISFNKQYKLKH